MHMMIRLILIVSLIAQLFWSMECCGVAVLRPDFMTAQPMACAAVGSCEVTSECCGEAAMACCDESFAAIDGQIDACALACDVKSDGAIPCKAVMCSPLEHKKPSAAAVVIDFIALLAHPLIPAPAVVLVSHSFTKPCHPSMHASNHTRQAWLGVWQN